MTLRGIAVTALVLITILRLGGAVSETNFLLIFGGILGALGLMEGYRVTRRRE